MLLDKADMKEHHMPMNVKFTHQISMPKERTTPLNYWKYCVCVKSEHHKQLKFAMPSMAYIQK